VETWGLTIGCQLLQPYVQISINRLRKSCLPSVGACNITVYSRHSSDSQRRIRIFVFVALIRRYCRHRSSLSSPIKIPLTFALTERKQCIRASDVLFLLSIFVTKCSVIWFCRRLFAVGQHNKHKLCEIAIGVSAVWCLGSILGVTVGCSSNEAIHANNQRCSNLVGCPLKKAS